MEWIRGGEGVVEVIGGTGGKGDCGFITLR